DGEVSVCVVCDGGKEEKPKVLKSSGKSFFEAVRNFSGSSDKKLYWGHTQTIVFGETALREAFDGTIDAIHRARDVYPDVIPVAVKGEAESALVAACASSSGNIFEVFANSENSRRFEDVPLWELMRNRSLFGACVIPTVTKNGDDYTMSGGAVLSEDGFWGYLSEEENLLRSLLTDKASGGYLPVIELGEGRSVSFEILANDIKIVRKGENIRINEKLTLSPAEVRGEFGEEEMRAVASDYLMRAYQSFLSTSKKKEIANILNIHGADEASDIEVSVDVKITSVTGGA
ncbi:MAG: hypothetical protein IIV97_05885, partial [Oscillospiraceae bacterium]|nr:hypothetical protein [Oscillospiraceae bacterium]